MKPTVSAEMKEIVGAIVNNSEIMTPLIATVVMARTAFENHPATMAMFYNELADKLNNVPQSFALAMHATLGETEAGRIIKEAKIVMLRNTQEMREAEALDEVQGTELAEELLRKLFQQGNADGNPPTH